MRTSIFAAAGIALSALATAATFSLAHADPLTRTNCWTANFDSGSTRTLCFFAPRRATMRNRNQVSNGKGWSTCEWSGEYFQSDVKVTVAFAPGSGRCSNRAASPQFTVVCDFNEKNLECRGASIVDGKVYEFSGTFQ